jgi:hypothetical protein
MADRQKGKQHDEECALQVKVFPVRSLNYCLPDSDAATVLLPPYRLHTMASGPNANATIKLVLGECRSVDSRSKWSWRDVLIVAGIVSYHEKPFRREPGS